MQTQPLHSNVSRDSRCARLASINYIKQCSEKVQAERSVNKSSGQIGLDIRYQITKNKLI